MMVDTHINPAEVNNRFGTGRLNINLDDPVQAQQATRLYTPIMRLARNNCKELQR